MTPELSAPVEDYLKAIRELEETSAGKSVATTELAARIGVAPPSVTGMVRRLAERGWVDHEPYRGVRLTDAGREVADRMLRRHQIIEKFLVRFLGLAPELVHDEAERLEHAVSDGVVDRMAAAMDAP
jgi:DtxR family transcriptional regulator, Mn-dependent transcriptional regulator